MIRQVFKVARAVAQPPWLDHRVQVVEPCNTPRLYSIFLLLPRGAGSICGNCGAFASTGVLLYVTVRVTTSRTLTRLERLVFFSVSQVLGDMAEKGD